jgi:hypothetical protein
LQAEDDDRRPVRIFEGQIGQADRGQTLTINFNQPLFSWREKTSAFAVSTTGSARQS